MLPFSVPLTSINSFKCVSVNGLGLIPGVVGRFDSSNDFRVPHIGWNALQIKEDSEILDDIGNRHVYFVHSYRATPVHPLSFCLKRLPS
jgi:imidazoleglycerol phosphate synthase glutamine amidotransferase subunit HisH